MISAQEAFKKLPKKVYLIVPSFILEDGYISDEDGMDDFENESLIYYDEEKAKESMDEGDVLVTLTIESVHAIKTIRPTLVKLTNPTKGKSKKRRSK